MGKLNSELVKESPGKTVDLFGKRCFGNAVTRERAVARTFRDLISVVLTITALLDRYRVSEFTARGISYECFGDRLSRQ